ncbi:MAG: hemerythrin domain-containing protein [Thermoproteus sp.]|nr:hemerythrin domain-containing protein [Thermoproteus sp.]
MPVRVKYVTSVLREHHQRILEALQLLERALGAERPDPDDIMALISFASKFVDACHHSVEEYVLFPEANRRGFPFEGGPIYVMVSEHGVGRYLVRMMELLYESWRRGDASAYRDLVDYARLYTDHISQHIAKEDTVLFPMLEGSVQDISPLKSVEEIEREADHDRWISKLEELKRKYA